MTAVARPAFRSTGRLGLGASPVTTTQPLYRLGQGQSLGPLDKVQHVPTNSPQPKQ